MTEVLTTEQLHAAFSEAAAGHFWLGGDPTPEQDEARRVAGEYLATAILEGRVRAYRATPTWAGGREPARPIDWNWNIQPTRSGPTGWELTAWTCGSNDGDSSVMLCVFPGQQVACSNLVTYVTADTAVRLRAIQGTQDA